MSDPVLPAAAGRPLHVPASNSQGRPVNVWRWAWAALLLPLLLYLFTAERGVGWQDSGEQQYRIISNTIAHPLGLPLTHPVQFHLGRLALHLPLEPAFAITLVSVVPSAVAIAGLFATLVLLTRHVAASAISSAALALAHTFWKHATITECYGVTAALLALEWLCIALFLNQRPGAILLASLFNGLGAANHLIAALELPVIAVFLAWALRKRLLRWWMLPLCAGCWLVGASQYLALVVGYAQAGHTLSETVRNALVGNFGGLVLHPQSARAALLPLAYIFYNFPGVTLPLAAIAIFTKIRQPFVAFTTANAAVFLIFALRHQVPDQFAFFFPFYMTLTLLAGLGLAHVAATWRPRTARVALILAATTALWPPIVYAATARILEARGSLRSMVRNKPYRNGYQAFFVPWSHHLRYAPQLNEQIYRHAGREGLVLLGDEMMQWGVRYPQLLGRVSPDVSVVVDDEAGNLPRPADLASRVQARLLLDEPVVYVPLDRDQPQFPATGQWRRDGDIYLLQSLAAAGESR